MDHQLQRSHSMKYYIESTKTTSGTRKIPMTEEVKELCQRIVANRNRPKREPIIDGYGGFLFFDKEGKPMVALHWEKYFQHILHLGLQHLCKLLNSHYLPYFDET